MELKFRALKKDEVEARVATVNDKGFSLLLYKDARCDMAILDESIGAMNWQRHHGRDNKNCIVAIWDSDKKQWIEKEDTGTESNTEKEKGLASDSFKRACFNWGIGRELYTAPFIWISDKSFLKETKDRAGKIKWTVREKFEVSKFNVSDDKKIIGLQIKTQKGNKIVYSWGVTLSKEEKEEQARIDRENAERLIVEKVAGDKELFNLLLETSKVQTLDELSDKKLGEAYRSIPKLREMLDSERTNVDARKKAINAINELEKEEDVLIALHELKKENLEACTPQELKEIYKKLKPKKSDDETEEEMRKKAITKILEISEGNEDFLDTLLKEKQKKGLRECSKEELKEIYTHMKGE